MELVKGQYVQKQDKILLPAGMLLKLKHCTSQKLQRVTRYLLLKYVFTQTAKRNLKKALMPKTGLDMLSHLEEIEMCQQTGKK